MARLAISLDLHERLSFSTTLRLFTSHSCWPSPSLVGVSTIPSHRCLTVECYLCHACLPFFVCFLET
ncbi:hypothetical protein P8452_37799 [Trifolium repens]|nr:hypothetical protein P8452_37799 [Trifolium repens]